MTIAVPSTPANYFHLLRRHALDGVMRPLIVFTPKSMLRNKAAVSDIKDFTETKFRSVLEEPTYEDGIGDRSKVTRILLTSGKIYYELAARKAKDNRDDVAIVRIEQLAPLPKRRLSETLDRYPNANEFFWVQEEPANQGAWPRFGLELPELLPDKLTGIKRISRRAMSAPSSGSSKVHAVEQQEIIDTAFGLRFANAPAGPLLIPANLDGWGGLEKGCTCQEVRRQSRRGHRRGFGHRPGAGRRARPLGRQPGDHRREHRGTGPDRGTTQGDRRAGQRRTDSTSPSARPSWPTPTRSTSTSAR